MKKDFNDLIKAWIKELDRVSHKTRQVKRIDRILKLIRKIWKKAPYLRLCQLIGNCFAPGDLYNMEDDELEKQLKKRYAQVLKGVKK